MTIKKGSRVILEKGRCFNDENEVWTITDIFHRWCSVKENNCASFHISLLKEIKGEKLK